MLIAWSRKYIVNFLVHHLLTRNRPLDMLTTFHLDKSTKSAASAPTRYAVRQVLDQELQKERLLQSSQARHNRSTLLSGQLADTDDGNKENQNPVTKVIAQADDVKRDFFGRVIKEQRLASAGNEAKRQPADKVKESDRVWVSFHEGFSNAVRKPITLKELMEGF